MNNTEYLLSRLSERDMIPVSVYNKGGECLYSADPVQHHGFLALNHEMVEPLLLFWKQATHPCILQDEYGLTFGFLETEESCTIWGPFAENKLNVAQLRQIREKYGIRSKDVSVVTVPLFNLIGDMQILYLHLTGEQLAESEILWPDNSSGISLSVQQIEMDRYRFSKNCN